MLDLDHGTYPLVTSSNPVAGAAATGIGIGPRGSRASSASPGLCDARGRGALPTEIEGPDQRVRELGEEYGTTTGRERRCGWLDSSARFAARVNGMTSLALTKLDVLSTFAEIPVCVRYKLPDGTETDEFPAHQSDFHHAQPVYETLPGWQEPLDGSLPPAAQRYVEFVEDGLELDVIMVGTGADRESVITRDQPAYSRS